MEIENSNMRLYCIGLNHHTAPIRLREKLALSENEIHSALAGLVGGNPSRQERSGLFTAISEMVIISTCNRIELYAASNQTVFAGLESFLAEFCGLSTEQFTSHLYRYAGLEVAQHLFEVAAGLDSLVVGEPQILGQVVHALELSRGQAATGPLLNRLFQAAIHAGKRTRTETAIARNPASVSSLTASLSERVIHPIADARIVILGAGEMAELAVEALRKRGANHILVVNRSLERAHALAERWDAQVATFENLNAALISADILISSTGAPHTILSAEMVRQAMQVRPQRPLVLIDIAVPRDIDPEAALIEHVRLYDIDNLHAQLEHSLAERMAEVPQVRKILAQELSQFEGFMKSLEMIPIIADIRQQAEIIRKKELEKTMRHLPDLSKAERARIDAMTQALVKKMLEAPTNRLRAEACCPRAPEYASLARTLFGLNDVEELLGSSDSGRSFSTAAE